MAITASTIKELREKTGAGMMACKTALKETNGDFEAAVDYLRKKGLAAAEKKQSRTAAEGIVVNVVEGNKAVILEVNCETDFVAKGDDFKNFAKEMASFALSNDVTSSEALKDQKAQEINELTLKCGEKIDVRRLISKQSENKLGFYNHGGKIGILIEMNTTAAGQKVDELLKDVSMHVAAASPRFLSSNEIDETFKAREAKIYTEQLIEQGKPEKMIPNIVQGKLRKLASEVCLLEQKFVKNPDLSVSAHIEAVSKELGSSVELVSFRSLVLGEGVEKKVDNLADEVAKMTQQQ
jgi:elongation factor Ts